MAVVVRKILDRERHVGPTQELLVLVAVRIEGADDEGAATNDLAHPPRQLRLGPRHAAHAHGAVQAEIDAGEWPLPFELGDHLSGEGLVGLARDPARAGAGPGP